MKKMWKRILAMTMSAAVLAGTFYIPTYAEDISEEPVVLETEAADTTEMTTETTETAAETTTTGGEDTELTEDAVLPETQESATDGAGSLNYIYMDDTNLFQGDEQTIVVSVESLKAVTDKLQDIRLGYTIDGEEETVSYTEIRDDLILFEKKFEQAGKYALLYVDIVTDAGTRRILFSDYEVTAEFQVEETIGYVDGGIQMETYAVGEDGLVPVADLNTVLPQMRSAKGEVVVVLDPGHDKVHCGAAGNGLREEDLTLKIAQYCKAELEQYRNVKVYMTRNDGSCLDPSSNGKCMVARCNYAASVGADLLVSIHIDAGSATGSGAMAIVAKKGNYRDDLSNATHEAGQKILDQLAKIGLASRGLLIRMSDSDGEEYRYPNGAVADWYSITRNCIKVGVPGIIMEHGFISNPSDVANFLNSDEKLKKIGVADATGIAEYFGLSKGSKVAEAMKDDSMEPYTDKTKNVPGFIAYLYQSVLGRVPTRKEVSEWVYIVDTRQMDGTTLVKNFLNSAEFTGKNYSDDDYVERLYEVVLQRKSEPSGKQYWISRLQSGSSRALIADQISHSPEFEMLCATHGMAQGSHSLQYAKTYPKIAEFVTAYYQGLMNRKPDPDGLEYWCRSLVQGGSTAADITKGFLYSPEFRGRNQGREEFVEGLYQIYLGRKSDPSGKAYWVGRLTTNSMSEKISVIKGFIQSPEYQQYCDKLGILVGKL